MQDAVLRTEVRRLDPPSDDTSEADGKSSSALEDEKENWLLREGRREVVVRRSNDPRNASRLRLLTGNSCSLRYAGSQSRPARSDLCSGSENG